MNKNEIVTKLKDALSFKYNKEDGTLDYTAIFKDIGMQPNQVKALFSDAKNPSLKVMLAICEATNMSVFIS